MSGPMISEIRFNEHNLDLAGGIVRISGNKRGFALQYKDRKYQISRDIGLNGSIAEPDITIQHEVDFNLLAVNNRSSDHVVRVDGLSPDVKSNSKQRVNPASADSIIIEQIGTEDSFEIAVSELQIDEPNEEKGVADTVLEPYTERDEPDAKGLRKILSRADDAEPIDTGGYRSVYKVDPSDIDSLMESDGGIIKVAWGERGRDVNRQEMQAWQAVSGNSQERLFCPITSIGRNGKYLIMKEAKDVGTFSTDVVRDFEERVKDSIYLDLDEYQIPKPSSGFDIDTYNIGRYKDRTVMIDYPYGANFELRSEEEETIFERIVNRVYQL